MLFHCKSVAALLFWSSVVAPPTPPLTAFSSVLFLHFFHRTHRIYLLRVCCSFSLLQLHMDSEASRKRRRFARTCSPAKLLSLRSLIGLLLVSMLFLVLASGRWLRIPAGAASFRPVLEASSSSLSRWSFSSSRSILDSLSRSKFSPLRIESSILFPDHMLFMVGNLLQRNEELDCFYFKSSPDGMKREVLKRPILSMDRFDEFQSVARCELPPQNYSVAAVELRRRGEAAGIDGGNEREVHQWDKVVYEAVLDGEMAVVFAKGLNLRPHRESNPAPFSCHFSLRNSNDEEAIELTTKAVTSAQEIIRCPVPGNLLKELNENEGIRIGITIGRGRKASSPEFLPSVAKLYANSMVEGRTEGKEKYELCACTMVWNQATALREWIMYHAWLGVERWFIYDNNSDDGIDDVIKELNSEHYNVSKLTWPWIKTQEAGFSHCALRAKGECNWIGFFDVDEFFFFSHHHRRRRGGNLPGQNSLRFLVSNFTSSTSIAELRTSCHSFGPSGLSSPPSQGVTVGYTCRLQRPERHKSFIRPNALAPSLLNVIHHFQLKKEFTTFNIPENIAAINHYKYQVWEVFRAKFSRRVATYVVDWQEEQNQGSKDRAPGLGREAIEPADWSTRFCEVWDTAMRDYVMAFFADTATGLLPWERAPPFL